MFAARTALTTREVYFTLSEKLRDLFQSEEGCVITLAMGVDPADDRCLKLLARVRTFAGKGGGKWQKHVMLLEVGMEARKGWGKKGWEEAGEKHVRSLCAERNFLS